MSKKKSDPKPETSIDQQVQQTLQQLGMSADWKRRISAGDVLYLLDQRPFLHITDTGLSLSSANLAPLTLITAQSGWKIHDYGHTLSSSPGELIYGTAGVGAEEDTGGEGGVGTIVNQAVITAFEMVTLAEEHGWAGIRLIDGHPLMAWAMWVQSLDSGMEIEGYTPTAQDYAKWRRVKAPRSEHEAGKKLTR